MILEAMEDEEENKTERDEDGFGEEDDDMEFSEQRETNQSEAFTGIMGSKRGS